MSKTDALGIQKSHNSRLTATVTAIAVATAASARVALAAATTEYPNNNHMTSTTIHHIRRYMYSAKFGQAKESQTVSGTADVHDIAGRRKRHCKEATSMFKKEYC